METDFFIIARYDSGSWGVEVYHAQTSSYHDKCNMAETPNLYTN